MSDIQVSPEDLKKAAKDFENLKNDLKNELNKADKKLASCRTMKSKRVKTNLAKWDEVKNQFIKSLESISEAGKKFEISGTKFENTDNENV